MFVASVARRPSLTHFVQICRRRRQGEYDVTCDPVLLEVVEYLFAQNLIYIFEEKNNSFLLVAFSLR